MAAPPPTKKLKADASHENLKDKPRLCLNFDVNETIMIGDPAGGDTFEESLNKILAKIAFVKPVPPDEQDATAQWPEWVWHDGSPLDPALKRQVEAALGVPLHNGYGLTEAAPTVSQTRLAAPRAALPSMSMPSSAVCVRSCPSSTYRQTVATSPF